MILAKKIDSQLMWSELTDNESESISGGISHGMSNSKSKGNHFGRNVNISITQIFQTNIVTIIGNIGGNVTIGQGNSSQGNRR
jgi:hypothetical protein